MLKVRLEAGELFRLHDIKPLVKPKDLELAAAAAGSAGLLSLQQAPAAAAVAAAVAAAEEANNALLPDDAVVCMLRREALLTKCKLHFLVYEHLTQERELRVLKQQLRQVCVCIFLV